MSEVKHDDLYDLRHSTAHLMAQAIGELYPGVKYAIGPPIEDGFYYDFDLPEPLKEEDLPRIEEKMREIARRDLPSCAKRCRATTRPRLRGRARTSPTKWN